MLLNTFVSTNSTPTDKMPLIDYKWSAVMPGTRKLLDYGKSHSNAQLFFGRGVSFDGVDQNIPITINADVKTICYSKAGGVVYDETAQTLTDFTINSELLEDTRNNYIFYDGLFTDTQKRYLENYPEKFLYREDSILKSKILTQSEIDNVVAYLPMCETDGYVRDLVGYSEVRVDGAVDSAPSNDDEETTYSKDSNDSYSLAVTTTGSSIDRPYVAHSFTSNSSTTITIVEFDVVVNSGEPVLLKMYNGTYFTFDETLKTGHCKFNIGTGNDKYKYIVQYFDGTKKFDITVTNFRVYSTTGNTPIANFTDACRDDAKNLSIGLQTCFWKRDLLGVPYAGSFDRLNCDGVGYADTGWMPDDSSAWQVEMVLDRTEITSNEYHGTTSFRIGCTLTGYTVYMDSWVRQSSTNNIFHLVVSYDGLDTVVISEDGEDAPADTITYTENKSFFLGNNRYLTNSPTKPIRLFKVHTEPQDPLALYKSAVKKGLLL